MSTDARFEELKKRLVAPGQPSFSCSEFHELYDYIQELQDKPVCNLVRKVAALEIEVKNLTASNMQKDEIKPCALSKWCIAYAVNECSLHLCRKFITS